MGSIVPLQPTGAASALAHYDVLAAQLLAEGRAATLSAARIAAMLTRLHAQRRLATEAIAGLQVRPASGDSRIDEINANLGAAAKMALAQIDALIQQAEDYGSAAK